MSTINFKKSIIRRLASRLKEGLLVLCMMTSIHTVAQTVIDDPADGDAQVPLEGGVTILLAAAAGLGAYRTARRQK